MPQGGAPSRVGVRAKASEEGTQYGVVGRVETLACEQHERPLLPKGIGEYFKEFS